VSSGRGQSPCDTGQRELRLDELSPGALAQLDGRVQPIRPRADTNDCVNIDLGGYPPNRTLLPLVTRDLGSV
jgi:hypothetical protein